MEAGPWRMSSQGLKGCECPANTNFDLLDAAGVKVKVMLECFRHGTLKGWVE